ncbi:MAG: hypothetical protein GXP28_04205 [Planctomycetes bacterium]|nr:hypothetical protein [Planctomycetota bacterium]
MKLRVVLATMPSVMIAVMLTPGCGETPSPSNRAPAAQRLSKNRRENSAMLIGSIASTLNKLPDEIVLELAPPIPILDDSRSSDGKEVLATCQVTPAVPDGPFNYLKIPRGNVDFRKLGVRAGDIVRYFVVADQESIEFGIRKETYLELPVRRLDFNNPATALIVETGLSGEVLTPERIEIWRFSDKRMNEIRVRLTRYIKQRKPAIDWEPSPDESALRLLTDRLNQWLRNRPKTEDGWLADPLLSNLPKPWLESKSFEEGLFQPTESRELQQAIWLRDISIWAKKDALTDIEVASALFDWTVRNIQLDGPGSAAVVHRPWQALMYGHGTAEQRAWVFAELCRQQQLDVVMLGLGKKWWLPALLSEGKLYLFDARLGLPLRGKKPGQVATLADLTDDPTLLENLNLDGEPNYPIGADDLPRIEAWLVASPLQMSHRAAWLQQALEGDDFVVLSADLRRVAKKLAESTNVSDVQLWPKPWETILEEQALGPTDRLAAAQRFLVFAQRPRLWKARVLHFRGTKEVPYEDREDPLAQPEYGHREAAKLYHNPRIRPPEEKLKQLDPGRQAVYRRAKGDASYWLGLLSYDRGKQEVAADWLEKRTLAATPEGPWTAGARYNLARTFEAQGKLAEAIELLQANNSPQRHGNLLRARWLQQQLEEESLSK